MTGTTDLVFIFLCVAAGAALAVQAPLNAKLGKSFISSFAAVISFALGLAVLFLYFVIDTRGFQRGSYSTKNVPWWAWLGGACGGFYVLIVVIAVPK
jgi:bacterial/archaeal transporter family-2 protein